MTALNPDLLRRIDTHLCNVSRLVARTVAILTDDRDPGPEQAVQCAGAATVCAQLAAIVDRRSTVFRASREDTVLRAHLHDAADRLTLVATLIRARACRSSLEAELDESFGHLAGAMLALDRVRRPAAA